MTRDRDLMDPAPDAGASGPRPDRRLPQIEVVTRDAGDDRPSPPSPSKRSLLLWFLAAFALVAVPASLWNFTRPPVYRAAATVLTIVPESRSGYGGADPDRQHVAIQGRLLLGRDLLEETLRRLDAAPGDDEPAPGAPVAPTDSASAAAAAEPTPAAAEALPDWPVDPDVAAALTADDLLAILAVEPVPATNLVEVRAEGDAPTLLAAIVNHWLMAYQALREREVEVQVGDRLEKLDERAAALEADIQAKRDAIDAFRERFDIVTLKRDSNEAVNRLETLQQSLAKAEDESVTARAELEALRAAIASGRVVVPDRQAEALSRLRQRAAEARVAVKNLRERYTEMFIQNDPNKRALPEGLEALEARIAEVEREGRREALANAREAIDATTRRVLELRRELVDQKASASRFSSGYAEYEDLTADLEQLEQMQRDTEGKRVELKTTALVGYPQVEIIEPAYPPRDPIGPPYWRDLGWTLVAAVAAGLLTVITLLWLDGRVRGPRMPQPVTGVRVWNSGSRDDDQAQLPEQEARDRLRPPPPARRALPSVDAVPRQLMVGEVEALWELAGDAERQLIGLLLCGVALDEAMALTPEALDLDACTVRVSGPGGRVLPLPSRLCDLLRDAGPVPAWYAGGPSVDDLGYRIDLLATDAGIAHADEVDAATLRDTYIIYLVRQGARLTELDRVAGPMSGDALRRFAPYSPLGGSRPLDQLDLTYPLFA